MDAIPVRHDLPRSQYVIRRVTGTHHERGGRVSYTLAPEAHVIDIADDVIGFANEITIDLDTYRIVGIAKSEEAQ